MSSGERPGKPSPIAGVWSERSASNTHSSITGEKVSQAPANIANSLVITSGLEVRLEMGGSCPHCRHVGRSLPWGSSKQEQGRC